jgi:hypothetical protein
MASIPTPTTSVLSPVQNLAQYGGGMKGVGQGAGGGSGGSWGGTSTKTNTSYVPTPKTETPVVSAPKIGTKTPVVIPTASNIPPPPPTVSAPAGTTTGTTGAAAPTPKTETPTQSNYQKLLEKMQGLGDSLKGKADAEKKLQEEQQLAQKTEQATKDYNEYTQKKLMYEQEIEKMRTSNEEGQFGGARAADIAEYTRKANADLANLAVQAQMSQGLEKAARQTIKDSIEAQFQPIQDQIDFYAKFAQLNQNDLSESERIALQEGAAQRKADRDNVQSVANKLGEAFLGDQTALSSINKVIADYTSGKISADEATSQMYSSVGVPVDVQLERQRKQQIINDGGDSSSTDSSRFTKTQLNTGAASAALPLEDFKALDGDIKNFYINSKPLVKSFNEALQAVSSGESTADEVKTNIDDMDIPDSVKDHLKEQLRQATPEDSEDGIWTKITNGIKSFFGN